MNGGSQSVDSGAGPRASRGQQNQPGVGATHREPFGRERTKVLDVVGDHRAAFGGRGLKDDPVTARHEIVTIGDGQHVVAGSTQECSDLRGQSKNAYQAEIDSACELIDFLRFNVYFLSQIYKQQPLSPIGMNNRMEYRPLEGFVLAVTPFNFTAIGGNLPTSAAMCGNVVVWKPANTQIYSASVFMEILIEAGLPAGVINLIYPSGPVVGEICYAHPAFAGVHFTGSTGVFQSMWKSIGENIARYKSYPRIVGETGGKDFVFVHPSANVDAVVAGLARGAFEYQGQKCSAASRAYLPANLAAEIKKKLVAEIATMKMGPVDDFTNFINAVIDEKAFNSITKYIDNVKNSNGAATILCGGGYDKSKGWFVEPTVIDTTDPTYVTMCEEIFGPVLTIYTYEADMWIQALDVLDNTSPYALTGAIFAQDRYAIEYMTKALVNSAGNFYINDKPTEQW